MGQSTSKNNNQRGKLISKKNNNQHHESTVFGYTMYHKKTSVYISEFDTDEFKGDDNLLFKPFLYGLGIQQHGSQQSLLSIDNTNSRTDSGFLLYEKNSQLWKDLMYIDQTYYNNDAPSSTVMTTATTTKKMIRKSSPNITTGDALYFNDISAMCLSMYDLDLSKKGFGSISPNIGLLPMIRKLDLSYNYLKELPEEIGYLTQLEQLSVSHNTITFIPDTICHLVRLTEFNISHNQLQELTPFIRHLDKLQTLILGHNQLKEINAGAIRNINSNLALLDLSYNPITILPAEITQLPFLRRLRLEGCPLTTSLDNTFSIVHNPPSLLEICARNIVQQEEKKGISQPALQPLKSVLTEQLYDYINSYKVCSHCHGPYFDSFVSRGRWIDRNDVWIPLEYRLCSAHWSDESDRIYSMFSATFPSCTLTAAPIHPLPSTAITSLPVAKATVSDTTTRRSRFRKWNNEADSPSSSTTTLVAQEHEPLENQPSTVKRWKHKMRNNFTLVLQKS